jgi:hypothetical protein
MGGRNGSGGMIAEADDTQIDIVTEPAVWRQAIARAIKEAGETSREPYTVAKRDLALTWIKGERLKLDRDEDEEPTRRVRRFFLSFKQTCELAGLDHSKAYEYAFNAMSATPTLPVARMKVPTLADLPPLPTPRPEAAPAPAKKPKPSREPRRSGLAPGMHNARLITFNGRTLTMADWARELGFAVNTLSARLSAPRPWSIEEAMTIPLGQSRATAMAPERKLHKHERPITHNGRTQSISAWAREVGIAMPTLHRRLNAGWSIEATLTCPVVSSNPVKPKAVGLIGAKPKVFLTHNGKTQALFEWANETGIGAGTLWFRVRSGWSDKDVLTAPVGTRKAPKARAKALESTVSTPGVGQNLSESVPDRSVPVARYTA